MAAINVIVIALVSAVSWSTAFPPERSVAEVDRAATEMHWSAPAGTHGDVTVPSVDMGLSGSAGARDSKDALLYATEVRTPGEKGQDQGYALGFHSNATIDHYRWVYVGEDGHTAKLQVLGGGLGFKYISLSLTSQDDHGIFYNISIYGRYEE